ncbi:YsnF/AvaK domain-containing protein [Bacillus sp. FJAT-27251]|uniref:YsnF/AvaK domain-containing protein n=1 Tax=Bacillus sp. FJAT-27251 TaxID=1684142 RepID=UPI0006A786CD|nr:YsnF/AvaK domain-containing protein [Bacillus sp. FJAT-27251]
MAKEVVGVFDNQEDLIEAIERYKKEGYSVQDFSIIGDTPDLSPAFENRTGVVTEDVSNVNRENENKGGFWQNLLNVFDGDDNLGGNSPSLSDRLVGVGLTEDAAREYEGDVRNGRIILLTEGAVPQGGAIATDTVRNSYADSVNSYDRAGTDRGTDTVEQSLELKEEQLDVSKERVQAGEVEVHKEVVEDQETINIPVTREEVYVERRAVNEETADTVTDDDETIRVPIMEEKVEVHKKPVVKEELVVGKREVQETEKVRENVKREEVSIESEAEGQFTERNMSSDYKDR